MSTIRNLIEARRAEKDDEGGFTLIELLIVIVVLGILAAIVVFAVQNLTGSSSVSSCKSDAKSVEVGVEAFKAQVGSYPTAMTDLTTIQTLPNGQKVGPWLRSVPSNDNHYKITLATAGTPAAGTGVVLVEAPIKTPAVAAAPFPGTPPVNPCDAAN